MRRPNATDKVIPVSYEFGASFPDLTADGGRHPSCIVAIFKIIKVLVCVLKRVHSGVEIQFQFETLKRDFFFGNQGNTT